MPRRFLRASIALLDNDDELSPDALFEVVKALNEDREVDFLYSDEDKIAEDGTYCDHYFKPDWSPDHLHSVMYLLHLLVFQKDIFYEAGGFRTDYSGAQDYDLSLRLSRKSKKIHHIAKILYHWRKIASSAASAVDAKPEALSAAGEALASHIRDSAIEADVLPGKFMGSFRVKHRIGGSPRVTLCITTNDGDADVPERGGSTLSHFVRSIVERTDYSNYELLIVDNRNLSAATRKNLADVEYRLVSYTGSQKPFNFARKANFAFSQIRTEHLVLLNDDLEVIGPEWLSALLEFSQQKQIGAVGGKLLFPDDTIQHAGVVLGVNGSAAHVYHKYPRDFIGYNGFTHLIRNYSAVTGACMATRREVIERTGGFDEKLALDFNDIAFCLAALQRGYRNVYTPYCELYHFESVTAKRTSQDPGELEHFLRVWSRFVERDPYYNPNLTRYGADFSAG
ncbi:MAG: glycosyltransferase [Bryobacteraceae bacterium]